MKAGHVMMINSIVLIIFGFYGFMADEAASYIQLTALLAGFILLFLSFGVNNSRSLEKTGLAITLIAGIVYLIMALERISIHNFLIAMLSLVSVMFYIKDLKGKKA